MLDVIGQLTCQQLVFVYICLLQWGWVHIWKRSHSAIHPSPENWNCQENEGLGTFYMCFVPNVNVSLCLPNRRAYIYNLRHMRSRNRLWRVKASWSPSLRSDRELRSSERERTTSSPSQSTPSLQVWKLEDKIKLKQWFFRL